MTDVTNEVRAEWARNALEYFASLSRDNPEDREDSVGDLLCNLMHYAKEEGIDFESELANGRALYEDEVAFEEQLD
ncbi:hypothetical protein [Marinobacterium jannaschii]|uniref:hypothetical protein n=1 Tax=Marinobacterium jannaschii TaxID=64970 RepID=UPI0004890368|nr:hypothetical protein [Marinobacterium jannaschii]